jgi:N-glycosylase/DNA lyase
MRICELCRILHNPARSLSNAQIIFDVRNGASRQLELPASDAEVMTGVNWGFAETPFTPAFWASQLWFEGTNATEERCSWSVDLKLEIVACLLGGHGITWELNSAAFRHLSSSGLLDRSPVDPCAIEACLRSPLVVNGRSVRYRFPRLRGCYVAEAINRFDTMSPPPRDNLLFRSWLLSFRGIGIKTASWITRNHRGCSRVAIIDIHVFRAGILMRLFHGNERISRDYLALERRYLEFAQAIQADPRRLDLLIWRTMKQSTHLVKAILTRSFVDGCLSPI